MKQLYFKTMAVRLQRFYKHRFAHFNANARMVQKHLKGRAKFLLVKNYLRISTATNGTRRLLHMKWTRRALELFQMNALAIRLQCAWRCHVARKEVQRLKIEEALLKLNILATTFFTKYEGSQLEKTMVSLKLHMNKRARVVQNCIKRYFVAKKINQIKVEYRKLCAAVKIQSCVRMKQVRDTYLRTLDRRLWAAVRIQDWI